MATARQLAITNENRSIEQSVERATAAAQLKPRSALEAMASRLQIQPANLKKTLMATAFSACRSEEEFMALVVVSQAYQLNPLLKEIYAFPAKGAGIVPMVSIDGWIRIMNEHPAFDGIEFDYINNENGKTEAIEAVIYRKDRAHPVKVIEYLEECKRNTDPWNKSPRRMLRHRALMQGARVAFGFSGIAIEGEEGEYIVDGGAIRGDVPALPSQQSLAEELGDEIPSFDRATGEVDEQRDSRGMTEVAEETARRLDGDLAADDDQEEEETRDETPLWQQAIDKAFEGIAGAKSIADLKKVDQQWLNARAGIPDEAKQSEVDNAISAKRRLINTPKDAGQ